MPMNAPTPSAHDRPAIEIRGLNKWYGDFHVLKNIDLTVARGEKIVVCGPSGSGKSTLIRCINRLEMHQQGDIIVNGTELNDDLKNIDVIRADVGMVFQQFNLFPHLTVLDNCTLAPIWVRKQAKAQAEARALELLDRVHIREQAPKYPGQLSGGQQQRVAVARALINQPEVLLLDEPLGALDLKLRRQMQIELKRIQTEVGTTFVHVTHDQEEAMTMADTVAVMNKGRIEQMGHPAEIYESPRTVFVANFLGQANLIEGRKAGAGEFVDVSAFGETFRLPSDRNFSSSDSIIVGVRPEKLTVLDLVDSAKVPEHHNRARGRVTDVSYTGVSTQYLVRTAWGQELIVFEQNSIVGDRCEVGDEVIVHWSPAHTFGLDGRQDLSAGVSAEVRELREAAESLEAK